MNTILMSSFSPNNFPRVLSLKTTSIHVLITFLITVVQYLMGAIMGGDLFGLMVWDDSHPSWWGSVEIRVCSSCVTYQLTMTQRWDSKGGQSQVPLKSFSPESLHILRVP